jgi:hypothetical protein
MRNHRRLGKAFIDRDPDMTNEEMAAPGALKPLAAALRKIGSMVVLFPPFAAFTITYFATGVPTASAQVNALCSGSPTANCTDVTEDGIRYTSSVTTVNVGDGVPGVAAIIPGRVGIELSRSGVDGTIPPLAEFQTIKWDTDGAPSTPMVDVVSSDGVDPLKVGDEFILVKVYDSEGRPQGFSIGSDDYTGLELAEYLAAHVPEAGGVISGGLTVNNKADAGGIGAPFVTTDATATAVTSTAGKGGAGRCVTILFWSWCSDAGRGGDSGAVVVDSNAAITVLSDSEGRHGVSAISRGGDGGDGRGWFGLFGATAGGGGDGGNSGPVFVTLGEHSDITTHGDKSHGVFAHSRGGDGGSGGNVSVLIAIGDDGGNGGDAGVVIVRHEGNIRTKGRNSHGIYAISEGAGAGSGSSVDGAYAAGGNGGGESFGAAVTVNNSGRISTLQSDSFGVIAQSIGGGGGDGGSAGGWFTVGGRGGSGGGSDVVTIYDSGKVETEGDRSTALFAQSVGGGGGNGGDAVSINQNLSVAVGGAGGLGGPGNNVYVTVDRSDIDTGGDNAHGIHAQSIGGGGGNGGLAVAGTVPSGSGFNVSVALGGNGGGGGSAGDLVLVQSLDGTTIDTGGDRSYGIFAQSIGGGGGSGGTSFAGSGGPGLSVAVSIGGKGGVAGDGKRVEVENAAAITTVGDLSAGIFLQSIGGGGGNGGFAGSLAVGGSSASVSLGGSGAAGGKGGEVKAVNSGLIDTRGQGAAGIFAQSIGGGGGNGGSAIAGSIGLASVSVSVGGTGGAGNIGGLVDILNTGRIATRGNNSAGIFAQSVGGGGGAGGDATSLSLAGPVAVAVAVGGTGGTGGNGGKVVVDNLGRIDTDGPNSDGVFAQSIGGSGGAGGSATSGTLVFPIEIEGVEIPAISANVAVGGRGGGGGTAGEVEVSNDGEIFTNGFLSNGVFAQSVGGSGGKGGHASNISIAFDATFTGKVAVGGSGGKGGIGDKVTVNNTGVIRTQGDFSAGVFAQSVGGGGGTGGNATNVSLSLTPPPTSPADFIPSPSIDFDLAIGGDGGSGATGGEVVVDNRGSIVTHGKFAPGIMAQSVGGAGGFGGDARTIQVELTADPMDFLPLTALTSLDLTMVFGGTGGDGGDGKSVTVSNVGNVVTSGAFAHGIVAQSIGGGGGSGGSAMSFEFSNADIVPEIPILGDIGGLTTLEMTLQGSGGAGGNGGAVTLNSTGDIMTSGAFAMGVVAQSVAGGGGLAGLFNPQGIFSNEIVDSIFNTVVDTEAGLSFAGSVGGAGNAAQVMVRHTGNITTLGSGAHGLFAQSAAGSGTAGGVNVTLDGSIDVHGKNANGIHAQSGGQAGNGNITLLIETGGSVRGGTGSGVGARLQGGADNLLTNRGSISALSGNAITSDMGNDSIVNHGVVTGSVRLGGGFNAFWNESSGVFNTGDEVTLGVTNTLTNLGVLAPGGQGALLHTSLSGNLMQAAGGALAFDLNLRATDESDRIVVSGSALLDGSLGLGVVESGYAMPGEQRHLLVAAAEGVDAGGLALQAPASAVVSYELTLPSAQELVVDTKVDFAPRTVGENARSIGQHVNEIQLAGGSESFAPIAARLIGLPDAASLAAAYEMLSPALIGNVTTLSAVASVAFNDAMHSCRQREGAYRFVREGECTWLRVGRTDREQRRTSHNDGYEVETASVAGGVQRELHSDQHFGIALAYQRSDLGSQFADVDGDRFEAGVLFKRQFDATRVSGSFSVGYGRYDSARRIDMGGPVQIARGNHDLWSASVQARVSHDIMRGKDLYVRPMLSATVSHVDRSGYQERGAGGANLDVKRASETVVTVHPAVEIGGEREMDDGSLLRPNLRLGVTHHLAGSDRRITATMIGAPGGVGPFTVTNRADKTYADVALGVDLLRPSGSTIRFDYTGQYSRSSSSNAVWVKYSKPF